jgi:hypothetical protein
VTANGVKRESGSFDRFRNKTNQGENMTTLTKRDENEIMVAVEIELIVEEMEK